MRPLSDFEKANTSFMDALRLHYGYLQPTENGLGNRIIDARREYREFLRRGIHDYENQPNGGIDNGRRLPAGIILADRIQDLPEASLYRANARGDRRIWFPEIANFVRGGETLVTLWLNGRFWLLNASRMEFRTSPALHYFLQAQGLISGSDDGFLGRSDAFWDGDETDSVALGKVRAEQTDLRNYLLQGRAVARCSICAAEVPSRLLVAGHIKPRSACSEAERRDYPAAAMLICSLGCDALFEWGYIVVDRAGRVRPSRDPETAGVRESVMAVSGRACLAFNQNTSANFAWHEALFVRD